MRWLWTCFFWTACAVSGESVGSREVGAGPAAGDRRLTGTLRVAAAPGAQSVGAYLGAEFTLETEDEAVILGASKAVVRDRLAEADGERVTVWCRMRPGTVPDPFEAVPVGPAGEALPRPAVCVVTAVEAEAAP